MKKNTDAEALPTTSTEPERRETVTRSFNAVKDGCIRMQQSRQQTASRKPPPPAGGNCGGFERVLVVLLKLELEPMRIQVLGETET